MTVYVFKGHFKGGPGGYPPAENVFSERKPTMHYSIKIDTDSFRICHGFIIIKILHSF